MPLYDLNCPECGEIFEVLMNLEAKNAFDEGKITKECPNCPKKSLQSVISRPKMIRIVQ